MGKGIKFYEFKASRQDKPQWAFLIISSASFLNAASLPSSPRRLELLFFFRQVPVEISGISRFEVMAGE